MPRIATSGQLTIGVKPTIAIGVMSSEPKRFSTAARVPGLKDLQLPPVLEELTRRCEQAIRNYDPCISCATHFLDLTVERT